MNVIFAHPLDKIRPHVGADNIVQPLHTVPQAALVGIILHVLRALIPLRKLDAHADNAPCFPVPEAVFKFHRPDFLIHSVLFPDFIAPMHKKIQAGKQGVEKFIFIRQERIIPEHIEQFVGRDLIPVDFCNVIGMLSQVRNRAPCDLTGQLNGKHLFGFRNVANRVPDQVIQRGNAIFHRLHPYLVNGTEHQALGLPDRRFSVGKQLQNIPVGPVAGKQFPHRPGGVVINISLFGRILQLRLQKSDPTPGQKLFKAFRREVSGIDRLHGCAFFYKSVCLCHIFNQMSGDLCRALILNFQLCRSGVFSAISRVIRTIPCAGHFLRRSGKRENEGGSVYAEFCNLLLPGIKGTSRPGVPFHYLFIGQQLGGKRGITLLDDRLRQSKLCRKGPDVQQFVHALPQAQLRLSGHSGPVFFSVHTSASFVKRSGAPHQYIFCRRCKYAMLSCITPLPNRLSM